MSEEEQALAESLEAEFRPAVTKMFTKPMYPNKNAAICGQTLTNPSEVLQAITKLKYAKAPCRNGPETSTKFA
jgi:hypothetical protein